MCQSKVEGGRRCLAHTSQRAASALIPRRGALRDYYAATDAKHFTPVTAGPDGAAATPGSTFTDPTLARLNDAVALAYRQRGNLDGDDRDELARLGTPEAAFKPGIRYLLVRTPGTVGIRRSDDLPDDTMVEVVRSKPGAPCSLVVEVTAQETTEVGTIIIGRSDTGDGSGDEVVFTAHPGLPIPVDFSDRMAGFEGRRVSLAAVRGAYDGDVWLNTRVTGQP